MTITIKPRLSELTDKELKVDCPTCSGKPSHIALAVVDLHGDDDDPRYSFEWHETHQIIQCLGCKTVSYRSVSSNSEEISYDQNGDAFHDETEKLFPARKPGIKGLKDDIIHLPNQVRRIYEETLLALSVSAPVLAAIGLRALLETVCKEKSATGNDLLKKIDSLVATQVLTPASAAILHKIRTLGNSAAHEVKPHSDRQLHLALDIVEHLLKEVYILPKQAESEFGDA